MNATSQDLRLLRLVRAQPMHAYAIASQLAGDDLAPDRATVYRRLARLEKAGLIAASAQPGKGPRRRVFRLAAGGEAALREELRAAMLRLMEAFHATLPRGGRRPASPPGPVAMISGSRLSGIELRILASFAKAQPRKTFLVLAPGVEPPSRPPPGLVLLEGGWGAIPLKDGHVKLLFVNDLPATRAMARAAREWARVLSPGGTLHAIAPAPLPRGVDPFVDFLADAQADLFPDVAAAPTSQAVARALRGAFRSVEERQEAGHRVWTARGALT